MRSSLPFAAAALCAVSTSAFGGAINDFNLIVFGNHQTGSNVWGRVAVGGNMSGNAIDIGTRLTPASNFYDVDSLLVGGNIASNINLQAGDVRYGGTLTGNINRNGGGPVHQQITHDTGVAAFIAGMQNEVRSVSASLWSQAANSTSGMGDLSNRYTFTASGASAGGTAVFNVNASVFSSSQWSQITLNNAAGAQMIVINVDASGTNGDVRFNAGNIDANTFAGLSDRIIWNFYNADTVIVQRELFGSMIGVDAHLQNFTNLNGSVAFGSFDQRGEVHGPNFRFDLVVVPLPGAGALGLAGLLGVGAVRRRRA